MRSYWDDRAHKNAAWYVDTSLDFDLPDMERFFRTGQLIVADALDNAPAELRAHRLAVEIGAGLGRVCLALADRFERVVGIDIAPEMVLRAKELVRDPRVTFELGDGASLSAVKDASADLVLSFTVFQHIPDLAVIDSYVREAGRVLQPGGLLVVQWNNEPGPVRWRVRRAALGLLQRSGVRPERHGRHAPEFLGARIPMKRMRRALDSSALELVGTRNEGTLYTWAWAVKR